MKMKKALIGIGLAVAVGVVGIQQASARVHDNISRGDMAPQFQRLDSATKEKMEKFFADTQGLRKQIAMKRAEKSALMHSETPNIEAIRKVAGEQYDLMAAMQEKAKTAGLFAIAKHRNEDELAKIEKFLAETQDLRKQMFVKGAEERAMKYSRTPNAELAAKLAGEVFDLRTAIHEKAKAAGITRPFGAWMHNRGGKGPGRPFMFGPGAGGFRDCGLPLDQGPSLGGEAMLPGEEDTMI